MREFLQSPLETRVIPLICPPVLAPFDDNLLLLMFDRKSCLNPVVKFECKSLPSWSSKQNMLRLTLINPEATSSSFKTQFASIFSESKPYKFKKDVWDFGDRLCIGNRSTNEIQMWEAIERNAIEINRNGVQEEVYIDILASAEEVGYGPCERKTTECVQYDAKNMSLEIDGITETLLISIKNPEEVGEIYGNLEYLLQDPSFSVTKYHWIGEEANIMRSLYVSRRTNDKKKKDLLAKTPRIALTAAVNNNRKRA
jgi:hypothetical protein